MAERIRLTTFIRFQKVILSSLGIWPRKPDKLSFLYNFVGAIMGFAVSYAFLLSLALHVVLSHEHKDAVADTSYYIFTQISCVTKLTMFILNKRKFVTILETLDSPTFNHELKHEVFVEKWRRFADVFIKNYLIVCYSGLIFHSVFPIFDHDTISPFAGRFPFDVQNNERNRVLVYAFQVMGLWSAVGICGSVDLTLTSLLNIGSAQIEILKHDLENACKLAEQAVNRNEGPEKYPVVIKFDGQLHFLENVQLIAQEADDLLNEALIKCVKHQEAIIKFLQDIEDVFGISMFVQFISSALIICTTGLQLMVISPASIKFYSRFIYFVCMVLQISSYCWSGDDIMVQVISPKLKTKSCLRQANAIVKTV